MLPHATVLVTTLYPHHLGGPVVDEGADLPAVLQAASVKTEPGVDLVIVRIDPDHDMAVRRSITTAVGEAING